MATGVARCEAALAQTVSLMHASLMEAVSRAPPCHVTADEAVAVDRAAVELEKQRNAEFSRIGILVKRLNAQFQFLEQTVLNSLCDAPLHILDGDIEELNGENLTLADQIVSAYDDAAAFATKIELVVQRTRVPEA